MHPSYSRVGRWFSPMLPLVMASTVAACTPSAPAPAAAPTVAPTAASKPTTAAAVSSPAPAASASAAASPAAKPAASPSAAAAASVVPSPSAAATAAGSLKGICPDKIVFQTNWWPEPDHGFLYQLIGPNGTIDTNVNAYTGPIGNTGVTAEVRAGGPAIGFQQVGAQMYADDSIFLGMVGTDEAIQNSAAQPTKAVFAWYAKNPQIFFWGNPAWDFKSVADVKASGATVLVFGGVSFVDVLEAKNLLDKNRVDQSYTGDPSRFVAADGNIVSQGFVTSEPYIYENEVQGWKKPVKFLLLHDDVPIYQDTMTIRADKLDASRACLQKLVPMMQQSALDYVHNPGPINAMIVDYTGKIKGGTQITAAGAVDAVQKMLNLGIVGNGTDGVYGSYDAARIQSMIDDYGKIYTARGKPPAPGLKPSDISTNEFLDKTIKL